jgi:hypothetical protein
MHVTEYQPPCGGGIEYLHHTVTMKYPTVHFPLPDQCGDGLE